LASIIKKSDEEIESRNVIRAAFRFGRKHRNSSETPSSQAQGVSDETR
jgi:hypothetical protein